MSFKYHLFKEKVPLLNKALDTYALRQQTIARNIANANSPGFKPGKVKFEELFREQQQIVARGTTTNEKHIPLGKKEQAEISGERAEQDIPEPEMFFSGENSVNIDKEMSEMAENQIRFRFASRTLRNYFLKMQSAISGQVR